MNSRFHKTQAEELIKQYNAGQLGGRNLTLILALAQVHATLATIPEEPLDA